MPPLPAPWEFWGWERVSERRLFQTQTLFQAGSAVVVYLYRGNGQEMSSALLEDDS